MSVLEIIAYTLSLTAYTWNLFFLHKQCYFLKKHVFIKAACIWMNNSNASWTCIRSRVPAACMRAWCRAWKRRVAVELGQCLAQLGQSLAQLGQSLAQLGQSLAQLGQSHTAQTVSSTARTGFVAVALSGCMLKIHVADTRQVFKITFL